MVVDLFVDMYPASNPIREAEVRSNFSNSPKVNWESGTHFLSISPDIITTAPELSRPSKVLSRRNITKIMSHVNADCDAEPPAEGTPLASST